MLSLPYPVPANEEERLRSLFEYNLLDTPPDAQFDRLVELAARLFDVPIVLISLLDRDRQYFKAKVGLDICETHRDVSFCAHAIVQDEILFIPDATLDPRFSSNPLVLDAPHIRFYAGRPLTTLTGQKVGTVCLIDTKPRASFSDDDRANLTDLAELVMDRMEMHRLAAAKSISQARFENIAATSPDAIICSNSAKKITFWNKSAQRLFGYTAEEIALESSDILIPDKWRSIYDAEFQRLTHGEERTDLTIELSARHRDGKQFPAEFSLSSWDEGDAIGLGAIVRDITERRQNEERLYRLASLDALTQLPNRTLWRTTLTETLGEGEASTVLILDLDGFKEVNDTLGHSAGDSVLRDVASRLTSICSNAIKVGRLGGDEFVALMPGNDSDAAHILAQELVEAISLPYEVSGQLIEIGVSIGVARAPMHGEETDDLLSAADLALYKAKGAGKGGYQLFTPAIGQASVLRRELEREIALGFQTGEFELFYQPQVETISRRLTGAEALMRWHHPRRGLLMPAAFIDVLSEKPSAEAVGEWAIRTACRQAADWRAHVPEFRIGVNLFEAQIRSGKLVESIGNILDETGLAPDGLELEIVENILLRNDAPTMALLHNLRALGVGLAFDDYGTGFASLSLLKRYPVSRLKIDRSFIRDVSIDAEDAAVVKAILYLGESFGLDIVAEGVESEAQLEFLTEHGCLEAQGYLFGKPMTAKAFGDRFLRNAKAA
tara:strand:- start:292 stop:2463 length:2172 start_codon:yes stop_codon:yes gene_type:complete